MPSLKKLSPDEIIIELDTIQQEWEVSNSEKLERRFTFDDFKSALSFVNRLGTIAEAMNHHPDIALRWGVVCVSLNTHEAAGITALDFKFAQAVDKL